MNAKEKLLWLAENESLDIEVEYMKDWRPFYSALSFATIMLSELRLSQDEMERRNPGFEVIGWRGREKKLVSIGNCTSEEAYVDGWLLRRKEERSCEMCGKNDGDGCDLSTAFVCIEGSKWTPKQPESKPVKVKAWVRRDNYSVQHLIIQRDENVVYFNEAWFSKSDVVDLGYQHTDTPDIEESWQKIGGRE